MQILLLLLLFCLSSLVPLPAYAAAFSASAASGNPLRLPAAAAAEWAGSDILLSQEANEVVGLLVIPRRAPQLFQELYPPLNTSIGQRIHLRSSHWHSEASVGYYQQEVQIPLPMWHLHLLLQMQQSPVQHTDFPEIYRWENIMRQGDLQKLQTRTELYALDAQHTLLIYRIEVQADPEFWLMRLFPKALGAISHYLPWLTASSYLQYLQARYYSIAEKDRIPPPARNDISDPSGWIRLHQEASQTQLHLSWDYPFPLGFTQRRLMLIQRYHEFIPTLQKVSLQAFPGYTLSQWILTLHLGPLSLHRSYWMRLHRSGSILWFDGMDELKHPVHGNWQLAASGKTTHSELSISTQPDDSSWVQGVLSYTPFPVNSSTLIASLMLMQRSSAWLLMQKGNAAQNTTIRP